MKILLMTNTKMPCGVGQFGLQHAEALKKLGHWVQVFEPTLEKHWPEGDLDFYDVVHVNYHAGTIGFLQPPPEKPRLLSCFLHESATGYWFGAPDVIFSAEETPGHILQWMPVPDVVGLAPTPPPDRITAATSTLRQAGIDWAEPALEKFQIPFDHGQGKGWIPLADEVYRLSRASFLIYWYGGANPGQSAGIMTGVAAQRPIILNENRMFESLREYDDELYRIATNPEDGIQEVLEDLHCEMARIPRRLRAERSWRVAAERMASHWG